MMELSFIAHVVDATGGPAETKPTPQLFDWAKGQWVDYAPILRRAKGKATQSMDGGAWRLSATVERRGLADMADLLGAFRLTDGAAPETVLATVPTITVGKDAVQIDFGRVGIGADAGGAEGLHRKVASLTEQLAQAKAGAEAAAAELTDAQSTLTTERRAARTTARTPTEVEAASAAKLDALTAELTARDARIETLLTDAKGAAQQIENAAAAVAALQAKAATLTAAHEQTRLALTDLQAKHDALLAAYAEQLAMADDVPAELAQLRMKAADLTHAATAAAAERDTLRTQIAEARPTQAVIAGLSANVAAAASQLQGEASAAGGFTLGRTTVTMRAILAEGGTMMYLPSALHDAAHGALTDITFELTPNSPSPDAGGVTVPALLGLTRSGVEMALRDIGLKPLFSAAPAPSPAHHGRTIRQLPEAGVAMPRGADILAVIGEQGAD